MSQTPTKGPFEVQAIRPDSGSGMFTVCDIRSLSHDNSIAYFDTKEDAITCSEALNIHHETKQTPRQILESREALRAAVSLLITIFKATADAADIDIETTQLKISRGGEEAGGLTIAEFLRKTEALTLAKEGGQA